VVRDWASQEVVARIEVAPLIGSVRSGFVESQPVGWGLVLASGQSTILEVLKVVGARVVKRRAVEVGQLITKVDCLDGRTVLLQSVSELRLLPLTRLWETEGSLSWPDLYKLPLPCTDFCLSKAGGLISLVFDGELSVLRVQSTGQAIHCLWKIALSFTPLRLLQATGDRFIVESEESIHLISKLERTEIVFRRHEGTEYIAGARDFFAVREPERPGGRGQSTGGQGGQGEELEWWVVEASLFHWGAKMGAEEEMREVLGDDGGG
jgi:hypothetical protein